MPTPKKNQKTRTVDVVDVLVDLYDYKCTGPIEHDGERYEIGEEIQLTKVQAAKLPVAPVATSDEPSA